MGGELNQLAPTLVPYEGEIPVPLDEQKEPGAEPIPDDG
jgi:hypothetical protein